MARTTSVYAKDMVTGQVADETRLIQCVKDDESVRNYLAEWQEFDADNAAWRTAHPTQLDPKAVIVADPQSPTMAEKVFLEVRVQKTDASGNRHGEEVITWCQINATNFPQMSAGFLGDLKEMFDIRRADADLVPV